MRIRVLHVDPGQAALILACIALVQLTIYALLILVTGNLRQEDFMPGLVLGAAGVFGAGIGGFFLAVLFNIIAPRVGGLTVRVAPEELPSTPPAAGQSPEGDFLDAPAAPPGGPGGLKVCPSCKAEVAAARSFCPACDHDFAPDPDAPDPAPDPAP